MKKIAIIIENCNECNFSALLKGKGVDFAICKNRKNTKYIVLCEIKIDCDVPAIPIPDDCPLETYQPDDKKELIEAFMEACHWLPEFGCSENIEKQRKKYENYDK